MSDLDEPAIKSTVDERGLTTPAEGITMLNCTVGEKTALCLQVLDDSLVGFLNVDALVRLDHRQEFTILINRNGSLTRLDDAICNASSIIVFTKAWRTVNDTCTGVFGDEWSTKDLEAAICGSVFEESKERFVAFANESLSFECLKDFVALDFALFEDIVETAFHADVDFLGCGVLPAAVFKIWVDCQGEVAW